MSGAVNVALAKSGLGDYIFSLDAQLLFESLITLISMIVLFLLLSYLLFNPARKLLEKRREHIREEMETAAKDKEDALAFKEEYDAKLREAEKEAEAILSETRKKALKKENEIVNEAKEEAARILDRANREIELEKSRVKDEVRQEIISIASAMAGKMVAASLDEKTQAQLIADTLKEMGDETWLS